MKRLPPLTAIEAFVQTARLGSVKAAADALALSSPALTRRIQSLERHVSRPLFERRHQSIHLNADGERLLHEIGPVLDELTRALERATGDNAELRLRLGVLPLFASNRLMPGLAELRKLHPQLHIDLDTGPDAIARLDDGLDAAIVLARAVDPGLHARRLGANRVVAIGARDLPDAPKSPADLAGTTVLAHRDLPDVFRDWCRAAGVPDLKPAATDMFDSGQLLLGAAAQGLGVAFMFEMHLEGAHDPRLTRLFGIAAESPYAYWFVCRDGALNRRPVRLFHDWLMGEFGIG
ncbi:MAG: LysR family transcriptional regulator [Sphingomonas sp.]|nr:LysR family transcriptional regulator [Sphingomonas sp.]